MQKLFSRTTAFFKQSEVSTGFARALNMAGNIGMVVTAGMLCWNLYRQFYPAPPPRDPTAIQVGEKSPIAFPGAKPTLAIATREGCHWCESSMGMYKKLQDAKLANVNIVAVVGDKTTDEKHLRDRGILFPVVGLFDEMKIHSTPYFVLVRPDGKVSKIWSGAQQGQKREDALLEELRKVR